ncbi:hypothetical protein DFQ26_002366 [Actinomortierella ambigua]|nr:hypothetical protein DFQ26_002366 [Actinomortierella ambigua]
MRPSGRLGLESPVQTYSSDAHASTLEAARMGSVSQPWPSASQQPTPLATEVDYENLDLATNRMQLGISEHDKACHEVNDDSNRADSLPAHEESSVESIKQDLVVPILASGMSLKGLGTPADKKVALWLLKMAANQGYILSEELLAEAHLGEDTTEPVSEATREPKDLRTTRLKAEKGDVVSQLKLHAMYRDGVNVERDPVQAMTWLIKATGGRTEIGRACTSGPSTPTEQLMSSRTLNRRPHRIPAIHGRINKEKPRKAPNKDDPPAIREKPTQPKRWVLDCVDLSQRPGPPKESTQPKRWVLDCVDPSQRPDPLKEPAQPKRWVLDCVDLSQRPDPR